MLLLMEVESCDESEKILCSFSVTVSRHGEKKENERCGTLASLSLVALLLEFFQNSFLPKIADIPSNHFVLC